MVHLSPPQHSSRSESFHSQARSQPCQKGCLSAPLLVPGRALTTSTSDLKHPKKLQDSSLIVALSLRGHTSLTTCWMNSVLCKTSRALLKLGQAPALMAIRNQVTPPKPGHSHFPGTSAASRSGASSPGPAPHGPGLSSSR